MYVPYQCCQKSFEDYYVQQTGGGLNYYRGSVYQRGYGLGGIFRSLFKIAMPLLKSGARTVGRQMYRSGLHLLGDVSRGENLPMAAKRRLKEAGSVLTDKATTKVKSMIGSGRKNKKRKAPKRGRSRRRTKKSNTRDIFS